MPNNKNIIIGSIYYLKIFRKYLGYRIYTVLALTLLAALSEGVGFTLIMPLFQELDDYSSSNTSQVIKFLQIFLLFFGLQDSIGGIIFLIAFAFILKGLMMFAATAYSAYLKAILLKEIKSNLFDKYSNMNYGHYSENDTGHFINIINQQTFVMLRCFASLMDMCSQFVLGIVYVSLAFAVTWSFGAMAIILGAVILIVFRSLNNYVGFLSMEQGIEEGIQNKIMIQYLHAFKYLISTNQSNTIGKKFQESLKRLISFEMRRGILAKFTESLREPIAVVAIMGILFFQLVYLEQPLAPLIVSIMLFYKGLNSIYAIQRTWQATLGTIGGINLVSKEYESQEKNRTSDGNTTIKKINKKIEFKDVSFKYNKSSKNALEKINLKFLANKSTALIGKSGSGKSTIVDLVSLILKPTIGNIFIDGIDSTKIKQSSWRDQIGYVSQDTVVFDDTIANNISMWSDEPLRDKNLMNRIKDAASKAYISDFIESLEDGYFTQVGDRGIRLSGGQKQRLFIARELFRKPDILILDEATSALDSESEEFIKQSIDNLKGEITIIVIAHRLSTIKNVDKVYIIDEAKIVEKGTYKELSSSSNSKLSHMIDKQIL